MKDNYVSNVEEILMANEAQKNKIEFLERERLKRDNYMEDLQQSIQLKNQSLREINFQGPNSKTINELSQQIDQLTQQLKNYYEQYQDLNAVLLMEQQMRLEDKRVYHERMVEFENKIADLRKYLHDKEDSFSSVVLRLKQYEEMAESTMEDKLSNFKKEIGQRHINQFIAEILKEKNFYQAQYQQVAHAYLAYQKTQGTVASKYPEVQELFQEFEAQNASLVEELVRSLYKAQQVVEQHEKESKDKRAFKVDPNKELIRLLKKEKLSKELHEEALSEAIQKNEELISIKQNYERTVEKLSKKCRLLYAENALFALRLAEFDSHYCRYITHNKRYYEEGEIQGLRVITEERLKEYGRRLQEYFESDIDLLRSFDEKVRGEVEKWGQFLCESGEVKREREKRGLAMKCGSVPRLVVGFDLDELAEEDKMIIEEY